MFWNMFVPAKVRLHQFSNFHHTTMVWFGDVITHDGLYRGQRCQKEASMSPTVVVAVDVEVPSRVKGLL